MNNNLKPKKSTSEEVLTKKLYDRELLSGDLSNSFRTPYEIFRNNTTAVEVIVKEVRHKGNKKIITNVLKGTDESTIIKRLNEDIDKLRKELQKANLNLNKTRRGCKLVLCEMKKQLEGANQRELKTQTKNLALQLEKEKLTNLLESKSNLVTKLKKEVLGMRRMIKVVLKGIRFVSAFPTTVCHSDEEYDEFEKDLRNNTFAVFAGNNLYKDSALESL